MTNPFETITKDIKQLESTINLLASKIQGEKRWLSTAELSEYIPYSKESINKKVQTGEFIQGIHFYQKQKLRMFDRYKIDEWVTSNELSQSQKEMKDTVLKKIKSNLIIN
jgi:biotin operon repressor